ncbi:TolC family outer membrane protein [Chlorobium sp.]|uniref:TolC family outer membrane protein n=1 Tax=Chlorobium sp. TaxID=1095 RepID=UPI0025C1B215|nr:TolC family outer membrane protein [Chlorobium sp.]
MIRLRLLIVLALLFPAFSAHADEVMRFSDAYERALSYDAKLQIAEAVFDANREEIGKARAGFRPNLRISAALGRNATESTSLVNDVTQEYFYNTRNYSVVLKQPIFSMATFEQYGQSKAVAAKSEALLQKERDALAVRTLEAYVNVLFAEDNLAYSRARVTAAKEQFQQAKRRFSAGFGTITEINEAQAHYDISLAEGLEHNNTLENSRREFEAVIGIYPDRIAKLDPAMLVLLLPEPHDVEEWVRYGLENNAELDAARQEIRIAEKQVGKNRAARYPVLDLLASRTFSESDNNYSIGTQYDTYSLNLQLSMPIYSGGYASASVRQASAQLREATEQASQYQRTLSSRIRKFYNGILGNIAQIRAYEQAVKSNEIALTGTKKGYESGFRSNVDVLNAQEKLYDSLRNLARSRYQYIINRIMLKNEAGLLTRDDIDEISGWLK